MSGRQVDSGLDDHLAGVVPCEESHQGLGHLVEPVDNCLSNLDNKKKG